MRSRAARLTLVILFVAALGVTAYLFWMGESLSRSEAAAARTFDEGAHAVTRTLLDVRSAQQAYVAAGQGIESWSPRVVDGLSKVRAGVAALRAAATSPQAQTDLDASASVLKEFEQLDKRIAGYTRGGNHLAAADLIFADGRQRLDAALAGLDRARKIELTARDEAGATFERRQVFALAAASAASVLAILLLASVPEPEAPPVSLSRAATPPRPEPAATPAPTPHEEWSPPKRVGGGAPPAPATAVDGDAAPAATAEPRSEPAAAVVPLHVVAGMAAASAAPATDMSGLARLCGDLACVADTRALPDLLERAAGLLDASGIILWIADPDGRELNPIFAQGYPPQLVSRLGTIPRDAENATAAAFRTSLLQTVNADPISDGAIAAPLVTPAGCIGVMAAEVRNAREKRDDTLAAAAIVAAQLATLVGPPSAKQSAVGGR